MIVKSGDADRFAVKPPAGTVAILVFGPDQGLVRERARAAMKSVLSDLNDPFRVTELDDAALSADPARLGDEAASISMTGGRRVVHVTNAANGQAKLFQRFLDGPAGDALVVVEAGDLNKGGALRRVFEEADNAAAIACYPDSASELDDVVRAGLKAEGLAIEPSALALAVSRLGSDRGVTRREIEKLVLYVKGDPIVTEAHVLAVMGDESGLRMDEVCDAAGAGDFPRMDRTLARLWLDDTSPVAVLRVALSHFQRLLAVRVEADDGGDLNGAIRKLRPPLFGRRADAFRAQAARWRLPDLEEALNLLYEAEALTKTTAIPAEAACGRALLSVAALARAGRG